MADWKHALGLVVLVSACGGSSGAPWDPEDPTDPGTDEPTASEAIRLTETADDEVGNGYAGGFVYDQASDTFRVTGLPFDGSDENDGVYQREDRVGNLGPYAVYEGPTTNADGNFAQFAHRAIYGVDPAGEVAFGIVRTGDYVNYGFGGYMLERNGSVTLPQGGNQQYVYTGKTAGIRDFDGTSGLEYTTGDMQMTIDFNAFNNGDFSNRNAVSGTVSNRKIYDINGNDITSSVIAAINSKYSTSLTSLLPVNFVIAPNVMDSAGQISGDLNNSVAGDVFEAGKYYVILSGKKADKAVGIFVVSSDDPRFDNVTVRETGGFILVKQ